jgi:hypothetical protein
LSGVESAWIQSAYLSELRVPSPEEIIGLSLIHPLRVSSKEGAQDPFKLEPDSMRVLVLSMSPDGLNVEPKPLPAGWRQTTIQPFKHIHLQPIPFWFHFNCDQA